MECVTQHAKAQILHSIMLLCIRQIASGITVWKRLDSRVRGDRRSLRCLALVAACTVHLHVQIPDNLQIYFKLQMRITHNQ